MWKRKSLIDYDRLLLKLRKFGKKDRSSFPYWFNHWLAYNLTALKFGAWKIKYIFHDIEKPFLKLMWGDYKRVQKWHRDHNRHHLEYKDFHKIDWEALTIDWECSRFTKAQSPRTAREEIVILEETMNPKEYEVLKKKMIMILDKFGA